MNHLTWSYSLVFLRQQRHRLTGKKLQSCRKLMPSHSPKFPPITEIIAHMERPVDTVVETRILGTGVSTYVHIQIIL